VDLHELDGQELGLPEVGDAGHDVSLVVSYSSKNVSGLDPAIGTGRRRLNPGADQDGQGVGRPSDEPLTLARNRQEAD
jgi:hypothetical protein